jgi:hypothetical protein
MAIRGEKLTVKSQQAMELARECADAPARKAQERKIYFAKRGR